MLVLLDFTRYLLPCRHQIFGHGLKFLENWLQAKATVTLAGIIDVRSIASGTTILVARLPRKSL